MKNAFTLLVSVMTLFIVTTQTQAQSLQQIQVNINGSRTASPYVFNMNNGLGKTTQCGVDTVNYTFNKTTQFQALTLSNVTGGANAFAQWYPAPQPISITGFDFYAWQTAGTNAVVPITCRIYNASLIDSLPTGSALATVVVNVDSTFGGGVLINFKRQAIFSTPVIVTGPYVITLETSSTTNVGVISNSWTATTPNGRSEWLSSVRLGLNYVRSYNVNVNSVTFNSDFIFQPYVSYSITADFVPSTLCNQGGNTITFENTSSPVNFSRFYSMRAFQNIPQFNFMWNYGDHTGFFYATNGTRVYNNRMPYTVTLTDSLIGWTRGCGDRKQVQINASPQTPSAFTNSPLCLGGNLLLSCDSVAGATGYYWTGPNGYTSTQRNPVINGISIVNQGDYSVRAISGQCSSAVVTVNVAIISTPSASNNGPLCAGQQLLLSVSNIQGATYSWTGPNGYTSNAVNPIKNNAAISDSGTYQVSITLPGCGTIGPYTTTVLVNPIPSAPTVGNNGPLCINQNLNLSASNIANASYVWTGPNGFSSSQQNPSRPNVINSFAGSYSVTATVNGCASASASTTVIINNTPATPTASSNGPLCVGQTLSLTATPIPGATFEWSGPNNFSSTNQNPSRTNVTTADAGTYSVYATVGGCASAVSSINVGITANTPTPVATSNGPICPGQSLQLAASNIAGASYSWTGPNGFTSALQNPAVNNVTTNNAGLYNVTAITSGCSTSTAGSTNVVINQLPSAPVLSNNGPLCDGGTLNLSASNITGATYVWSGPDGFTSSLQNPNVTNVSAAKAGLYSAYVTVTGCGTSPTANTSVLVRRNPLPPSPSSNSPVCNGDTIKFLGSSFGTGPNRIFNWSGPNNFFANLQNPTLPNANSANAGNYQVTVTDSGCTSAAAFLSVALKSNPQAPVASNSGTTCEGANVQLNATNVAGANYAWTGPGGYSSNAQNPLLSAIKIVQEGTYSVRVIVNGCSSSASNTTVVVTPLPATPSPSNSGPVCAGTTLNLSTTAVSGATYSWSGPNAYSSSLRNPTIINTTANMSGTYSLTIFQGLCASIPGTTEVVVNPVPNNPVVTMAPTNGNLCAKDSLMLFANFLSGATYEWTGPAGFGSVEQNPVVRNVIPANSGSYSVKMTKAGCESKSTSVSVTVNQAPQTSLIFGPDTVRSFETSTYNVTGSVGSVFNWVVFGGTQQSGGTTNTISVLWGNPGSAFVRMRETNSVGCNGTMQQFNVNVRNTTSIGDDFYLGDMLVYPNPSQENIFVQLTKLHTEPLKMTLYNLLGQTVTTQTFEPQSSLLYKLDTEALHSGIYLMQIELKGQKRVVKVQVKH